MVPAPVNLQVRADLNKTRGDVTGAATLAFLFDGLEREPLLKEGYESVITWNHRGYNWLFVKCKNMGNVMLWLLLQMQKFGGEEIFLVWKERKKL